ncbi:SAM-dependent methyltransferase [Streptomyces yaizuensis]|uniref:SAM-dependent methyltransferase n=1 Tax=Streptomyces yaizuensis TaxID=2989713 RepID=A0ABQ5NRM6_9ACTN|nr:SAM-dependent methyltransferase [Streptomyces sp. YSPA8]GLF93029.1 SAM-dependent methyltransferase [Streptomyces sp. YSPA8]
MAHEADRAAGRVDTTRAHSARVYDYILGGKDHYQVDIDAGRAMCAEWPALPVHMRANRAFMQRAARHLARAEGIRQFLDIGTGLPTSPNLHEVVQAERPDAGVVYVDNDPIVLAHAEALLTSAPEGRTAYVDADLRDPGAIIGSAGFRSVLDPGEPVGLMVIGMLHFILPPEDHVLLRRLLDPLPPGSFLAATIGTADFAPQEVGRVAREYERRRMPMKLRTRAEAESFFDGLDLVPPGLCQVHHWRPEPGEPVCDDRDIAMYGALARKR